MPYTWFPFPKDGTTDFVKEHWAAGDLEEAISKAVEGTGGSLEKLLFDTGREMAYALTKHGEDNMVDLKALSMLLGSTDMRKLIDEQETKEAETRRKNLDRGGTA